MAPASRRRVVLFRCILVALGLFFALGIAEIGLRLMGVAFPVPYLPDNQTGSRLQPGWSGWVTKEGGAFVTINRAGFRDRNHEQDKPPDTIRILVLGDSYVEALQVAQNETFWSVAELRMQQKLHGKGKTVEVIAMGVSGWGTAQQFEALMHHGLAYQPDVVVLAFLAANDVRNNSRKLEGDPSRPYYELVDGALLLDGSFRNHPRFLQASSPWTKAKVSLINRSRLLQLAQEIQVRWKNGSPAAKNNVSAGLDDACFREPQNDAWKGAWQVTERLIQEMNAVCRQRSILFCVATVTHAIQVHPELAQREAYQRRIGVDSLDYSDARIQRLGETVGFPVFRLAEPLRAYAENHQEFLHGFANTKPGEGHWNVTGHRVVGEFLASELLLQLENRTSIANPTPPTR